MLENVISENNFGLFYKIIKLGLNLHYLAENKSLHGLSFIIHTSISAVGSHVNEP